MPSPKRSSFVVRGICRGPCAAAIGVRLNTLDGSEWATLRTAVELRKITRDEADAVWLDAYKTLFSVPTRRHPDAKPHGPGLLHKTCEHSILWQGVTWPEED